VSEPSLPLTGGCNCGAVRFEISEPLLGSAYCHCRRCQRRTGTAASPSAAVKPGTFSSSAARITSGAGTHVTAPTRHFAAPAAQRCSHRTRSTRRSSMCAWDLSMAIPACDPPVAYTSPVLLRGSQFPTTAWSACRDLSQG